MIIDDTSYINYPHINICNSFNFKGHHQIIFTGHYVFSLHYAKLNITFQNWIKFIWLTSTLLWMWLLTQETMVFQTFRTSEPRSNITPQLLSYDTIPKGWPFLRSHDLQDSLRSYNMHINNTKHKGKELHYKWPDTWQHYKPCRKTMWKHNYITWTLCKSVTSHLARESSCCGIRFWHWDKSSSGCNINHTHCVYPDVQLVTKLKLLNPFSVIYPDHTGRNILLNGASYSTLQGITH